MRKFYFALCAILFMVANLSAQTGALILRGSDYYRITNISPNGKWACGAFNDGASTPYAFRWDLTSGEILPLTPPNTSSLAFAVSDNGVVAGAFPDTEATGNKAPVQTSGYWKDGQWYHLETIDGEPITHIDKGGLAYCISRDGRRIGGAMYDKDGKFVPVKWYDGKIEKVYGETQGAIYDMTEDGSKVCGWADASNPTVYRTYCLWEGDEMFYLNKNRDTPYSIARCFSPDEKTMLCERYIYDVDTKERIKTIPYLKNEIAFQFEILAFASNNIAVGYTLSQGGSDSEGVIYDNNETRRLKDYLDEKGVDLGSDFYWLSQGSALSEDGNTIGIMAYIKEGSRDEEGEEYLRLIPMIIKLNENLTTREPASLKASQLDGIYSAKLTWNAPLANAENVTEYKIYRNGNKIKTVAPTVLSYIDSSLEKGDYTYEITAMYNQVESEKTTASLVVKDKEIHSPRNLYAVQSGLNNVRLGWEAPLSNLPSMSYVKPGEKVETLGRDDVYEIGVRFNKEETAEYAKHYCITNVTFYPMISKEKWIIRIYKDKEIIYTEEVDGANLVYGYENNIKLKQTVTIPDNCEITVGIKAAGNNANGAGYGMVSGENVVGYTDMVRLDDNEDFYSLYEEAAQYGLIYSVKWAVSILLSPKETGTDNSKEIKSYNIYSGNDKIGDTKGTSYLIQNQEDGEYTYGIEAVYENGETSSKTLTELTVKANNDFYKIISDVETTVNGNKLSATWEAPINNDETVISYANNTVAPGLVGPESNNYSYLLGAIYDRDKLNSYVGYQIKGFRFYPTAKADYTFILRINNIMVLELPVDEYTQNTWNTVWLDEPITIQAATQYFLIVDCFDVEAKKAPVALDSQVPYDGISNLLSTDQGESFQTAYSANAKNGNWMLGMIITSAETSPLPVQGYNVEIDGTKMNDALLTQTKYEQTFESQTPDETHKLNVNVVYEAVGEKKGSAVFFTINPTSIDENLIPSISVYPNPATSYVRVDGNVESIVAYTIGGTEVARSNENTLNVTNLQTGLYILKITVDGKETSAKVNIAR